jgi:hypothetical protein
MFTTFSHTATTQENIAKVLGEKKYAALPTRKKILLEVMIKYILSDRLGEYNVLNIRQILEKYKPPTTSPGHQLTSEASVKSKIKKYYRNYLRRLPTDAEVNKIYKIFKETQELFQKNKSTHELVLLFFKIHFLKPTDDYQKNLQELSKLLFPTTQGSKQEQQPKQDKQSKQEKVKSLVDIIRNIPKGLFIEFVKHFIDDKAYDGESLSQLYETFSKKYKHQTQIGRQGSRSSGSRGVGGEISGKLFTLKSRSSSQR